MYNIRHSLAAGLTLLVGVSSIGASLASDHKPVDETAHTSAAVIALDEHWMQAEINGNTEWLSQLLLPEYRSVGADGVATSRATILAHAAEHRGSDKFKHKVEAWLKTHPTKTTVVIHGDVAIVSFYDPRLGAQKGVHSSDIFVYEDGHWHALYSQHSEVNG
ncbi:MAG TPA: nuclear transport factor 2 family protein [Oleiagrimonas sp.]|nr:nuclear transport factor 2 family protein [Oleiagrimonas sp.]